MVCLEQRTWGHTRAGYPGTDTLPLMEGLVRGQRTGGLCASVPLCPQIGPGTDRAGHLGAGPGRAHLLRTGPMLVRLGDLELLYVFILESELNRKLLVCLHCSKNRFY